MEEKSRMGEKRYNLTLEGIITLLSPLSHIGETRGTDSLLVRRKVLDCVTKKVHEVFMYSGNAFRGTWRDCGTLYLFEKLGHPKTTLDTLHFFTSGGSIVGEQTVDLERAEKIRAFFPLIAILGGNAKSQTLEGKMNIGFGVPIVRETQSIIPERFRSVDAPPWRILTEEIYFTRQDDSKKEKFKQFIVDDRQKALPEPEQQELFTEEKKEKKKKENPQQMRAMVEAMCAGTQMYHRIDLFDMTELELGAFVSCLDYFSRKPYLGGKSGVGFGLCTMEYEYWDNGTLKPFMTIAENHTRKSELPAKAQETYDQFLLEIYNQYLALNSANMVKMLSEAKL